jgi:hypothetical protein
MLLLGPPLHRLNSNLAALRRQPSNIIAAISAFREFLKSYDLWYAARELLRCRLSVDIGATICSTEFFSQLRSGRLWPRANG